jgi:calcium uniporter protein, mitochondrial
MKARALLAVARTPSIATSSRAANPYGPLFRPAIASPQSRQSSDSTYAAPAEKLNHDVTKEEKEDFDQRVAEVGKEQQIRTPWHREGSDEPPVARNRSASAMTKGIVASTV